MARNILHNITYGMYIVSANKGAALNGQIVNTVFQVTSEPVVMAVSVNRANLTHEYICAANRFTVSVLADDAPLQFIGRFGFRSGRQEDKFAATGHRLLGSGCPVVMDHCLGFLEAEVSGRVDCGDHTVFLGRMTAQEVWKDAEPLTYARYHTIKRGLTPSSAPTYMRQDDPRAGKNAPAQQEGA